MTKSHIIWITGASSGIGEALALQWAVPGTQLILSGRNHQQLEIIKDSCILRGADVKIIAFDLTRKEEIAKAVAEVQETYPRIDIIVNNGGISQRSRLLDTPEEVARRIMEVDFWGHVNLTQQVLPFMIRTGGGKILVISSLAGLFGFPMRSMYASAKHALHGFFETLRLEHFRDNIRVTMVCPGRVKTNISLHALTSTGKEHGLMDRSQEKGVRVERCAAKIIRAVNCNRKEVIIGKKDVIMPYLKRYIPWLFYIIAKRIDTLG
ncbi:MAG TPA: SDR family oxidoreductase [Prolixibacteraceae bacterium]